MRFAFLSATLLWTGGVALAAGSNMSNPKDMSGENDTERRDQNERKITLKRIATLSGW